MKLNNKGYAITIIVFGILIVFIIVLSSLLVTMNNSVKLNKTVKEEVIENIQLNTDTTGMSLTERIEQLEGNYNQVVTQLSNIKKETIDEIYPVGSIYISTTDDNIDDVVTRFGGQWEKYSQGRTLVGEGTGTDINGNVSTFVVNNTGGEYSHTLTTTQLPSHSHSIPELSGSTNNTGSHIHDITASNQKVYYWNADTAGVGVSEGIMTGNNKHNNFIAASNGAHSHSVTTTASNTGNIGSGASFNVQNPYITVYMYKRIK